MESLLPQSLDSQIHWFLDWEQLKSACLQLPPIWSTATQMQLLQTHPSYLHLRTEKTTEHGDASALALWSLVKSLEAGSTGKYLLWQKRSDFFDLRSHKIAPLQAPKSSGKVQGQFTSGSSCKHQIQVHLYNTLYLMRPRVSDETRACDLEQPRDWCCR